MRYSEYRYVTLYENNRHKDYIRLYRGLEQPFDPKYDTTTTDAPNGYSTWTDNPELAKQYGKYVYYIDLPLSEIGDELIDNNPKSETYGERNLFVNNEKAAGLNGISGDEYLVYTYHDLYSNGLVKQLK